MVAITSNRISVAQLVARRQVRKHLKKIREREYMKLQALLPSVASKKVSKVQVIEEAVRYIEELHTALLERFRQKHGSLAEGKAQETVRTFVSRMMDHTANSTLTDTSSASSPASPRLPGNINRDPASPFIRHSQLNTQSRPIPTYLRRVPTDRSAHSLIRHSSADTHSEPRPSLIRQAQTETQNVSVPANVIYSPFDTHEGSIPSLIKQPPAGTQSVLIPSMLRQPPAGTNNVSIPSMMRQPPSGTNNVSIPSLIMQLPRGTHNASVQAYIGNSPSDSGSSSTHSAHSPADSHNVS